MALDRDGNREATVPLCWLHGFAQTGSSARAIRSILAARRAVLAPDLPGFGTRCEEPMGLWAMADAVADALPTEGADVVGYSMGARVGLHVALAHPERVRRLVLIGGTRGIADEAVREARRASDERLATRILEIGVEAFLAEWRRQPIFADLVPDADEDAARLPQSSNGLAGSLRLAGTGSQEFLDERVREMRAPVLAIAGARDDRFAREAEAIARSAPSGDFAIVPAAGHAAHVAQPRWTADLIDAFLGLSAPPST